MVFSPKEGASFNHRGFAAAAATKGLSDRPLETFGAI
jgi:hypothetical protein